MGTVRAFFPLSVSIVDVDSKTLQSELISLAMDHKFKSFLKISLDVDDDASFVMDHDVMDHIIHG